MNTQRGRGRPSTGTPVLVRIPPDDLEEIDAAASARGTTRAAYLRQIIKQALLPPVTTSTTRRKHRS